MQFRGLCTWGAGLALAHQGPESVGGRDRWWGQLKNEPLALGFRSSAIIAFGSHQPLSKRRILAPVQVRVEGPHAALAVELRRYGRAFGAGDAGGSGRQAVVVRNGTM